MSLGFALVHPQRLSAALDESFPRKIGWDDGADLTLAAAGLDLGDDPLGGFLAQLRAEALELLGQLQGLALPGGPFASISAALTGEGDGVAAWLRRIGDFLAGLDPLRLKATLTGHVDAFFGHFPGFDLRTLDDRLRRLAQRALDVLRAPLLGGRDDGAAHRAYRAAALILARLEPLLALLEGEVEAFDIGGKLKAALLAAIDGIPSALLEGLARIGRILRDDIGGIVEAAASLSVSVSVGPSGLVEGREPTHRDDGDPQPFAKGHWLWVMDLVTSGVSLFWSIWGFQRARGLTSPAEWIEFLLASAWRIFRDTIRLFVQPAWLSKDSNGFVRMLFSEWGDLFVRFLLNFLCSLERAWSDSFERSWCNYVMNFGNRFLKWFALELQPRVVYQFLRSIWYLRSWHDDPSTDTRGDPRFTRVIWAGWAPMLLVIAVMGLFLPGESYDLQAFGATGHEWATAGLVLAIIFQIAGTLFMPWILMGEHPFRRYSYDSFDFIALSAAMFTVLFIGVETLRATNVGETAGDVLRGVLYPLLGIPLLLIVIGQSISGASTGGDPHWFEYIGAVNGWLTAIIGSVGMGLIVMLVWWFVRRDGEDQDGDFEGLDVDTSPYRLPFPKGEMWFCGQGFHGIFSHTWRATYDSSEDADNLFSYDFNNVYAEPACAARQGFVQQVSVDNPDGGGDANEVDLQHWDWVPGHDAGTDQERELTQAVYVHLAQNKARCAVGQLVAQGYNVAAIDDTGTSAVNHLHFHVFARVPRALPPTVGAALAAVNRRDTTLPTVFGDSDARGFRSFQHVDGKPISLAYYTSENVGEKDDAVTTTPITQPMRLTAAAPAGLPLGTAGHTHRLDIGPELLGTTGLPASLTLTTSAANGHAHAVTLTAAQLQELLTRGTLATADATGPLEDTSVTLATLPTAVVHRHTLQIRDAGANTRTLTVVSPPGGRLISDVTATLDLVGAHIAVDADGQAANHWLLGAHRPAITGTIALDRGPTGAATLQVGSGAAQSGPTAGAGLSSARQAADLWIAAWGDPALVRPVPVVVLESRARGSSAQVQVAAGAALSVWGLSGAQAGSGTGAVADLGAASVASLVPLVQAALGAGPGVLPIMTLAGPPLGIEVANAPVASFAGSSGRIEAVMREAYNAATGRLRTDGALPLVAGRLALDGHVVPLVAAPARLRLDRATARLDRATLRAEPLALTVLGATHAVAFRAADVGSDDDATLDLAAARIAADADGVRAWRDGDALVIETVAAGAAVTLQASKGSFSSPTATGAAPDTAGLTVQDTTALTPAELRRVILDAASRAVRAAAPVLSVTAAGGDIVVTFDPSAASPTLGAFFGWAAALTPAPDASSSAVLRLTPPAGMPDPMWADVTVGGDTWRIAVDADVARVDLAPLVRAVGAGETLSVTTAAGTQSVALPEGASLVDQARAFAAVPGLTARIAWRWCIENARFQAGDLVLTGGTPSALPGMGLLGAAPATQISVGPSSEAVRADASALGSPTSSLPGIVGGSPDDDLPAFTASAAGDTVTLTAHAGMTLDVVMVSPAAPLVDPTGLTGSGATRTSAPVTPGLLTAQALVWQVRALRDGQTMAETRVQLAAAPAKARSDAAAGWIWTDTAGATSRQEVAAERGLLTITVTIPGSPDTDVTMTVDLTGAATRDEVVARIRREAALVEAWRIDLGLHVQTRGAGTGWRLRLQGAATLASLGFNPARFAQDGSLTTEGGGQVRDHATATATELAAAFTAGAPAAAWPRARHYTVHDNTVTHTIELRTLGAPITVTAEPQRLLDALAPAPVAGGVDIAVPGSLDLDQGWIRVMQGGELRQAVSVVGSRAAVQAAQPLPTATSDVLNLLTAIAGQPLDVTINGLAAPTWVAPADLASIDELVAAMIRHFVGAHVRVVTLSTGSHLRISSRQRGATSAILISPGAAAGLLGFTADLDSNAGGQDPGVGTFNNLASVSRAALATALAETAVEEGQGVLAAVAGTTGVTLTPSAGQIEWTSAPAYVTGPASDPGGSLLWVPPGAPATPFRGATLTQAWSAPGPLVAQPLRFHVADSFPTAGAAVLDRVLFSALWANPARLGPWTLPADLGALDGQTLRLVLDGANVDITFSGLAALLDAERPRAIVAAIEGATGGRVRARVTTLIITMDRVLRIESAEEGSAAAVALGAAPSNDARALLGNPAPVGATGSGNVARLSAVTGDELAAAVRSSFVVDSDLQQDAVWSDYNPDGLGNRLVLASQKTGTASAVIPVILPAALRMRRSMQRGPARGGAVVLPPLTGDVTLDGSLHITLNGGNAGARAVPATTVEVRFPAGTYSPRRVWLRIHEELQGRGVGMAGIYPDGASGWRIAIETRLPGLQGTVRVPADAPASNADVVSRLGALDNGQPRFGRGWPGVGNATLTMAGPGLRTANSGAALVVDRTWRFTPGGGAGTPVALQLRADDAVLSQLAARLDGVLAAPGIGIARLHDADGCVYVELIDTTTLVAVFDAAGLPAAGLTTGIFGQPAIPPSRVGAMGDMWVDEGMQLRSTNLVRTCRLAAFVSDGTAAGRVLDPQWVRVTPDVTGTPVSTPYLFRRRYGVLIRAEGARSDGYRSAGEMLVSTGTATVDGADVPIVHQARYWFMIDARGGTNDDGLGPVALPDGTVVIEVSQP